MEFKKPEVRFTDTPPKVWCIGMTRPHRANIEQYLKYRKLKWNTNLDGNPLLLAEFGGRVCYESFHNPKGATTEEYLQNSIIALDHGSVLEHVVLNFAVASLPRSTQLELVRHRAGTGFSFRSTRYADNWIEFIIPPAYRGNKMLTEIFMRHAFQTVETYNDLVKHATLDETITGTLRKKRIREAARMILGSVGSDGEVTMNLRTLRHILQLRSSAHADLAMREFADSLWNASQPYVSGALRDALIEEKESLKEIRFERD